MSQSPIGNSTMEIKNHQPPTDNVSFNLDLAAVGSIETSTRAKIFKDFGPNIRTFLGSFCEMTAVASLLRKKCVVLLSVFLCSGVALEKQITVDVLRSWFCVLYMCLGYQVVEDIVRYRDLKKTNEWSQEVACLFEMIHQTALTLSLFIFNLGNEEIIGKCFMLLTPLIFLLEGALYYRNYSTSRSLNIVTRLFYILQSSLIAAKMNNLIDLEWKTTLVFIWIYLGIHAVYATLSGLMLVSVSTSSIINYDREYLALLKNEAIGYIWHISYNALSVAGFVFLIGYFGEIDDFLEAGLYFAQKLSLFLGIYTVLLFPILKNQTLDRFQDLLTNLQVQDSPDAEPAQKKYTLIKTQDQSKKEFFLMISSTYFSLLKAERVKRMMQTNKSSEISNEEVSLCLYAAENIDMSQKKKEDNLCYICENGASNAIIAECGHGGVCCTCIVKSIRSKNECMECRKPVKAIYKIKSESKNGAEIIVEACEFVQVIEA